jgi:hypothetical protein
LLQAAALSFGLAWCGACALSAAAQTEGPAEATPVAEKPAAKPAAKKTSKPASKPAAKPPASSTLDEVDPGQPVSDTVVNVAGWVIASGDNRGLPFAIVDKDAAQLLVFTAEGKLKGLAPVLVGSAIGDESAPGVGDRELKDIPLLDRTTPAGRYLAGYGPAAGGKTVLWVDYATAVSIHPLETTRAAKKEKRKERLASATPEDNRITHGCINVSPAFYTKVIASTFKKDGGVFYVLPDTMTLQYAFPAFEQSGAFAFAREPKKPPAKTSTKKRPASKAPATKAKPSN